MTVYINGVNTLAIDFAAHEVDIDAHHLSPWEILRTGEYYDSHMRNITAVTLAADTLYAVPLLVARDITVDLIMCDAAVGVAGNARLGIYNNGTNLYPGTLVLDAGVVDITIAGPKTIAIGGGIALPKGIYFLTVVSDVLAQLDGDDADGDSFVRLGRRTANIRHPLTAWNVAFVYGALPNPFTGGATLDYALKPLICVRVSSLD